MVAPTLGELVPLALAVMLSPIPVIAVVVVAGSARARTSGPAFALGWMLGLTAVTAVAVVALGGGDGTPDDSEGIGWGNVVLGLLLLGLAAKSWAGRPRAGAAPEQPGWMATLGDAAAPRALMLGAALAGANPKNLAMAFAAAGTIAEAGLTGPETIWTVAGFVVLGSLTVVGAIAIALLGGRRGAAVLATTRDAMEANSAVILSVVLLLLGGKLLGDGLGGLLG